MKKVYYKVDSTYNDEWKVEEEWLNAVEDAEEYDSEINYEAEIRKYESMLSGVMQHLDQVGGVEFAVLKDHNLGKWWAKKSKELEKEKMIKTAKEKLYKTLSEEERKLLGIRI